MFFSVTDARPAKSPTSTLKNIDKRFVGNMFVPPNKDTFKKTFVFGWHSGNLLKSIKKFH